MEGRGGSFGHTIIADQNILMRKWILPHPLQRDALVLSLSLNSAAGSKHSHSRNVLSATLLLCFSGCSQGTPSYSSSHHLFRGAAAPCQSIPMTRLTVSGEPSPCSSSSRNTHGVASAQRPPASSSRAPFVSGGDRPLTTEPPPRWARRRRRSVARTIAAELAENRRLARELSKREQEKLDRLIAIGEEASAQQDTANELRRDAVVAVRRLATAVEEATGAFQLGLEKLLQRLISNTKS